MHIVNADNTTYTAPDLVERNCESSWGRSEQERKHDQQLYSDRLLCPQHRSADDHESGMKQTLRAAQESPDLRSRKSHMHPRVRSSSAITSRIIILSRARDSISTVAWFKESRVPS